MPSSLPSAPAAGPVTPSASGARVAAMREILQERLGKAQLTSLLSPLAEDVRREYLEATPLSWVRTSTDYAVHDAVAASLGADPVSFHEELLRLAMDRTFKTVWRIFLRFSSDEALIARTPMIYSRTRNVGEMKSRLLSPGRGEIVLSKYPGIAPRDVRSLGVGLSCILKLTGRRDVKLTTTAQPDGAVFHLAWRV